MPATKEENTMAPLTISSKSSSSKVKLRGKANFGIPGPGILKVKGFSDEKGRFIFGRKPKYAKRPSRPKVILLLCLTFFLIYLICQFYANDGLKTADDDFFILSPRSTTSEHGIVIWQAPTLHLNGLNDKTMKIELVKSSGDNDSNAKATTSSLSGSFGFEGTEACLRRQPNSRTSSCQIHFPVTITPDQTVPGEVAMLYHKKVPSTHHQQQNFCSVTMKGYKPPLSEDDLSVIDKVRVSTMPNQDRSVLLSPVQFDDIGSIREEGLAMNTGGDVNSRRILNLGLRSRKNKGAASRKSRHTNNFLLALFDGHGQYGHLNAEVALFDLPFRILKNIPPPESLTNATRKNADRVTESYYDTMTKFLTKSFLEADGDENSMMQRIPSSGCTAVLALKRGSNLHVATVGDSTVFLAVWRKNSGVAEILHRAIPHKPGMPAERARIEAVGGLVEIPPKEQEEMGASSRVRIFERGMAADLAMSRSLGDRGGKYPKAFAVLTAEPSVFHFNIQEHFNEEKTDKKSNGKDMLFLVATSDGVTDMVPVETVATRMGRALFGDSGDGKDGSQIAGTNRLEHACQGVVQDAAKGWAQLNFDHYRDDITLIATKVEF